MQLSLLRPCIVADLLITNLLFFHTLQDWLPPQLFSLYGIRQEKNLVLRKLSVEVCGSKSLISLTPSAPFPKRYVAGRQNSSMWAGDLGGWCYCLLIVVLRRAQSTALHWEPAGLFKLQCSLTCISLLITLPCWMGCWCLEEKKK